MIHFMFRQTRQLLLNSQPRQVVAVRGERFRSLSILVTRSQGKVRETLIECSGASKRNSTKSSS